MPRSTRRPMAAERRVGRSESEVTETQKVLRYEGASSTKQCRVSQMKADYVGKPHEATKKSDSGVKY